MAESMNRVAVGMAIVSPACEILEMNRTAADIINQGDVLAIEKGRLVSTHAGANGALSDTVTKALGSPGRAGCFITLPRNGRRAPLHVMVAALRLDGERRATAAAVYLSEPERTIRPSEQQLTILFGLSAAEARVAAGIVEGLPVPALAERLHVSVHTVRTQLKSVFAKTGAQRQSDLVRMLTSGLALVATERG